MKKIGIVLISCMYLLQGFSQEYSRFQNKIYLRGTDTLGYRILFPHNYDSTKQYPLVVFLHGAGERGRDNQKQLINGAALFLKPQNIRKFPAIVIFPQCSIDDFWARTRIIKSMTDSTPFKFEYLTDVPMNTGLSLVSELLDSLASAKMINNKQVYVGGLSMGGMGTFELLWRKPGFFAAAFVICGGGEVSTAGLYGKAFPIWIFHGDKDPVVDVNDSRKMAAALKTAEAKVKYTEYAGVKHDSWKKAFEEPQLVPWLFNQRKE